MALIWQAIIGLVILCLIGLRLLFLQLPVHMDEYDYLFIGRQLINGQTWPSLSYVFGSNFNWYLFGWFDFYIDGVCSAGICGPRLLAFSLGILSLGACYTFTQSLSGSHRAALLATLMLAISAPHIFISSITTYDVVAFTLFSWSLAFTWLLFGKQSGVRLHNGTIIGNPQNHSYAAFKGPKLILFIAGLLALAAAALSKYIVLLLLPWIFVLSLLMTPALAIAGAVILSALFIAYFLQNRSSLLTLIDTQLNGVHSANITRTELTQQLTSMMGLLVLALLITASLVAGLLIYQQRHNKVHPGSGAITPSRAKTSLCVVLLILLACTLPAYHLVTMNRIAFAKHLVYSQFVLLPMLASLLVTVYDRIKQHLQTSLLANTAMIAFVCLYGFTNILQLSQLKHGYPDMTSLVNFWDARQHAGHDESKSGILSEDPYIFRYLASPAFDQAHISETTYLDNDLDGQFTEQDVIDALWDRKFHWVLLTDQIHPRNNARYRHILKLRDYRQVFNKPYYLTGSLSGNHLGNVQLFKLH